MTAARSPLPARLQDLPPVWARFCLRVERFILRAIGDIQGRHILLACSAGSDSLALLLVMQALTSRLNIRISAAHLDHGLRQESRGEAKALADLCEATRTALIVGRSNVGLFARKTGLGVEEAGRTLRYRFLLGMREKINADMVMTAHHADDLAEDVLMRLLRGAGWPGLAGMPAWDHTRRLARPLLHAPKSVLRAFLRAQNLCWHEDPSNEEQRFLRNRIRHAIMPGIKQEFPGMLRAITQIHALGALDQEYFATLLAPLIETGKYRHFLEQDKLEDMHPALRLRLFKAVLDGMGPGQVRHDALLRLEQAWQENRRGAVIQFPGAKTATIAAQGIRFAVSSQIRRGEE